MVYLLVLGTLNGLQFYIIPINPGAMNGIFNCLILQIRLPFYIHLLYNKRPLGV